ncbi:MAG: UbiA family prenyltransferase, partial [Desulfuromonadales bacterium]|nr:UbiA family prenyltransferase [Desulfuromonadales bacterium]
MSLLPLIKITRPKQWIKNLMVFFPPFLSGALFHPGMLSKGFVPFMAFCFASSTAYIFNDLRDLNQDALHPRKKFRPLAAGEVAVGNAKGLLFVLLAAALLLGWSVSSLFLLYVTIYLVVT